MPLKGPEHNPGWGWLLVIPRRAEQLCQTPQKQTLHILLMGSGAAPLPHKCLQSPDSSFQMVQLQQKYNQKSICNQLTFKLHNFSILGFGEPFQTHFSGEGQSNATAPQQETNLLPTSILREEGKVTPTQR